MPKAIGDDQSIITSEGCIFLRRQQQTDYPLTYAATIPGIDSNPISTLVRDLTGLQVIEIDNKGLVNGIIDWLIRRKSSSGEEYKEATILHTQYPHDNQKQAAPPSYYSKDGESSRAFIVLQNPLRGIPARFRKLEGDRYTPRNRLLLTYESLISDQNGVEAVYALNNFLGGALTDSEAISCIWRHMIYNIPSSGRRLDFTDKRKVFSSREVVSATGSGIIPSQQQQHLRGDHKSDFQYSLNASQLDTVMKMLIDVAQRYKDEEQVYSVMMEYQREIQVVMSQIDNSLTSTMVAETALSPSNIYTQPLEVCGRQTPFPLSSETKITQHYSSQCSLFNTIHGSDTINEPSGLLLLRGYERFGRTGNELIEFLHALQYAKENDLIVGIMLDSWAMSLITKFWHAFPTNDFHSDEFLSNGFLAWKNKIERVLCIKIFLNEEDLAGYSNIVSMSSRELFMLRYNEDVKEYIRFHSHNIRMLFRSYNRGEGRDVKNQKVGNLCSVVDGMFGEQRQSVTYSVIHSRSLEGEPGLRLLGIISETSGCDPVAALNMEPEYIKAILSPLGLLNRPILFISDNQRPEILHKLRADPDIGPQIRLIPPELSWVGGDLAVAIVADAFIGNPASTFSGFIAKSRIALGFENNYLFRAKKGDNWVDSCEDRCIFYKWVMRSMA
ncbi:hypothetical protein HJC23_007157 [Cyclotella cryptica]|uniref:Uncharacterized protein n=1 Tax=Cyclotella cryptica TaxID=29204 RepID=A0ABD3QPF8_9STRA